MNRETKFRGLRIDKNEMVFGDLIHGVGQKEGKVFILPITKYPPHDCDKLDGYEVIPESVGQYTGLKNNGKEMYAGDVTKEGVVFWDSEYLGFFVKGEFDEGNHHPLYDIPISEIVGNIHQSPELLKNDQ